ncbi:hypothetical protein [Sorangium cellulosum]|uniref:Uncharacterized protein n=1 Tax=Sorangium cellulosum So0157-2 TaxID=1254432 RepID=S4XSR1_SORCE|nr:hypothetical protein [Sorangium cellulosum]AGP34920.1 hypothetical protein SCE1572_10610 [Sorangium cellulosum So0157-2]
MPVVLLNHDFVEGMAYRADLGPVAVALQDVQRRLGGDPMHVHPALAHQATGEGPFIAWGNQHRNDVEADRNRFIPLLLRLLSGPFVTDLPSERDVSLLSDDPALPPEPPWRREAMRHLAAHALSAPSTAPWVLSFDPRSDLSQPRYRFGYGDAIADVDNLRSSAEALHRLGELATRGLVGALATLEAAAQQESRLIVLDRARDAARRWNLDCPEATLFRALVDLATYAAALDEGLSRELAAERYHKASGVPMSRESGEVARSPTCKRQRTFVVPGRGEQYFDMHAKPGASTRIHVWTDVVEDRHVVYVGHCGEHLLLPGGKR